MPCVTPDTPLAGCRLLYTRNHTHWQRQQPLLQALGADVRHLPLLDTRPLPLTSGEIAFCAQADALLFTSANAVSHLLSQYSPHCAQDCVAIGQATAQALAAEKIVRILAAPAPYHSESLLDFWQPQQRSIALICAPGGRELLFRRLSVSNRVRRIRPYQRYNPTQHWPFAQIRFDVLLLSSAQTLTHLQQITPQNALKLLQCHVHMACISQRVSEKARESGFQHCLTASVADEPHLIQTVSTWWLSKKGALHE